VRRQYRVPFVAFDHVILIYDIRKVSNSDESSTCTHRNKQFFHSQICPNYATQWALCNDP
jgi:hypothetical protein